MCMCVFTYEHKICFNFFLGVFFVFHFLRADSIVCLLAKLQLPNYPAYLPRRYSALMPPN